MKWFKRIGISFGIAILVACSGAIILFNWSVSGWKALTVSTGSMRPSIPPGSLVLMHSVPDASLKVGDVITYANPLKANTSITHRVVETYKLYGKVPAFITKGDANPNPDRPIMARAVQGKVIWHLPHIGAWMNWTKTLIGIVVIVYLPALIVLIGEMRRLIAYYRKFMPYKSALILARERAATQHSHKFALVSAVSLMLLAGSILMAYPVQALLKSNTVSLVTNSITVAPTNSNTCAGNSNNSNISLNSTSTGSNTNNVNVTNTTNQTATTGDANNSNNTNGGSATSGNATNCNNTDINIVVH